MVGAAAATSGAPARRRTDGRRAWWGSCDRAASRAPQPSIGTHRQGKPPVGHGDLELSLAREWVGQSLASCQRPGLWGGAVTPRDAAERAEVREQCEDLRFVAPWTGAKLAPARTRRGHRIAKQTNGWSTTPQQLASKASQNTASWPELHPGAVLVGKWAAALPLRSLHRQQECRDDPSHNCDPPAI